MRKDVKKVDLDETIERAAQVMRNEKIGSVVVVGEKNVKGIVTVTDIVYKHVASGIGRKVSDIMTSDLITIEPGKTIEEAAKLMVQKRIEKLLVFDSGRLVGIITNNDVLRVEPALYEILLERMKLGSKIRNPLDEKFCESCGNYSDTVTDVGGSLLCAECAE